MAVVTFSIKTLLKTRADEESVAHMEITVSHQASNYKFKELFLHRQAEHQQVESFCQAF